jgi:multisubunit Na+/H+ antiporter MnhE subunit
VITNAASAALLLLGGVLAIAVPRLTAPFWPDPPSLVRPWRAVRFLAVFLVDIVTANWRVARQVVGPLHHLSPPLVEVPLDLRDPVSRHAAEQHRLVDTGNGGHRCRPRNAGFCSYTPSMRPTRRR